MRLVLVALVAAVRGDDYCPDDPDWHKSNKPSRDCAWVGENVPTRCTIKGEDKAYSYASCQVQCQGAARSCGGDSTSWFKNGNPSKDCDWARAGAAAPADFDPAAVASIGTIEGDLVLDGNAMLQDLYGFDELMHIGGDFIVSECSGLQTISGFDKLQSVDGPTGVQLVHNPNVASISGFGALEDVGGLAIATMPSLTAVPALPLLREVLRDVNIPSLDGLFASLKTIGGELTFERLAGLESINGSALPALESAGSVSIATLDDVVAIEDLFPRLETITGGDCAAAATDAPTAAPTACVDSASWHKKNNPSKDCAWVGKHLPERCAVRGEEKFLSVYACVATCLQCGGESGPCDDDPSFYLYDDEWRESGAGATSPRGELRVPLAAAPTALGCDGAYGLEVSDMKQLERLAGLERLRSVGDDVLVSKLDGLEDAAGFLAALETVDGAAEGSGVEAGVLADFCASRASRPSTTCPSTARKIIVST
ncbi:hypothetical protein JL722_4167 [Aureococcus anophagefferens]|nr:hypothetical protein JL722_4167 [Aureococcus anophagefferens]